MTMSAMICAAALMGQPVPAVDVTYFEERPPQEYCLHAAPCRGMTVVGFDGRISVYNGVPNRFDIWVHEACHVIQWQRSGRFSENECHAVSARAWRCKGFER